VAAVLSAVVHGQGLAQSPPMVIGAVGGYTVTHHVWDSSVGTDDVSGFVAGGFVDVQTPLSWLTAGAELAYTQRGSDAHLESAGRPVTAAIRGDYLTFAVRVRGVLSLGPARVYVVGGPQSDFMLRSRMDPILEQILDQPATAAFGVHVGAGVGARVAGRVFVEVEARLVEGLQASYSGDAASVRNRSREIVGRVALSR
jgi:hypothetical protein